MICNTCKLHTDREYTPDLPCWLQVNEALSEESRETQSVGALRDQLADIEAEVEAASSRLALTKTRIAQNLQRVDQLKAEAVRTGFAFLMSAVIDNPTSAGIAHSSCTSDCCRDFNSCAFRSFQSVCCAL